MNKLLLAGLALVALPVAMPAHAVSVSGISAAGGNGGTVFNAGPGALSIDFEIANATRIVVGLVSEADDAGGIAFNSVIDSFLTLNPPGYAMRSLTLTLGGGATFTSVGSASPAFSSATGVLSGNDTIYTLSFDPFENFGLTLGDVGDGGDDFLLGVNGLQPGSAFTLTLQAGVPEPAGWAMMIAGFGLVGAAMRRRAALPQVAA